MYSLSIITRLFVNKKKIIKQPGYKLGFVNSNKEIVHFIWFHMTICKMVMKINNCVTSLSFLLTVKPV